MFSSFIGENIHTRLCIQNVLIFHMKEIQQDYAYKMFSYFTWKKYNRTMHTKCSHLSHERNTTGLCIQNVLIFHMKETMHTKCSHISHERNNRTMHTKCSADLTGSVSPKQVDVKTTSFSSMCCLSFVLSSKLFPISI